MLNIELRQEKGNLIQNMRSILDKTEKERRDMTASEKTEYDNMDRRIDAINAIVSRSDKLNGIELESKKILNPPPGEMRVNIGHNMTVDPEKEFRNLGEFLNSLASWKRDGRRDPRLDIANEKREQQMGVGAKGGFALPEQFDATLKAVTPQDAIMRPRATVIPAGTPPDAKLSMPALDQTAAQNMYGGVNITHTGESLTMTETDENLRQVTLEPKEMSAYLVASNKLLNNWEAGSVTLEKTLRWAINGQEDYDFLRGSGVNRATGVINHASAVVQSRDTASNVKFNDVYNMLSRVLMRGPLVWAASQTIIPQLASMVDAGSHAVWLGNGSFDGAAGPMPSTLMGIPLLFAERLPALGTKGDLCLLAPQFYLIKDGSGPLVAQSEHIYFLSNRTVFKIVWNVDGHPWLTEPIPLEGSTTNTVSPFVVLDA